MRPYRFTALVTLLAFLVNISGWDGTIRDVWAIGQPAQVEKIFNAATFNLPADLGTVKDKWLAPLGGKTVIQIQDAHCNYFCQSKISDIIEHLNREYSVSLVNLEGGAKGYDTSIFADIKNDTLRHKAAEACTKEGFISGAENLAIAYPGKIDLWGVEDTGLYVENLRVYRNSLASRNDVEKYVGAISRALSGIKLSVYSDELLTFDKKYSQYKAGNLDLKSYLTYLIRTAQMKAFDVKKFRNVYFLAQALSAEDGIDFKKANLERDALVDELEKRYPKAMCEDLIKKTLEFKTEKISQSEFYTFLTTKAKTASVDVNAYPELKKYIVYISIYDAVEKGGVFDELGAIEDMIKNILCKNENQKELMMLSKNLALMKNMFNISLTAQDHKYYKENERSFDAENYVLFVNNNADAIVGATGRSPPPGDTVSLDKPHPDMARFYEYSLKRDEAFIRNVRFEVQGARSRGQIAVIVTGGFHTDNLCRLFKEQGISYISIMPNFKSQEGYESPYMKILSGKDTFDIRKSIDSMLTGNIATASPLNRELTEALNKAGLSNTHFYGKPQSDKGTDMAGKDEPRNFIDNGIVYGYFDPATKEIVVDVKKARVALKARAPGLTDNELKGFVHCHEIFHLLIDREGIRLSETDEEILADIFARRAMGVHIVGSDYRRFVRFARKFKDAAARRQLLSLPYFIKNPTKPGDTDFWLNLRSMDIDPGNIRAQNVPDYTPMIRSGGVRKISYSYTTDDFKWILKKPVNAGTFTDEEKQTLDLALRYAGDMFATTYIAENVAYIENGKRVIAKELILQKRLNPFLDIANANFSIFSGLTITRKIAEDENDAALLTESQKVLSEFIDKYIAFIHKMWERGLHDFDMAIYDIGVDVENGGKVIGWDTNTLKLLPVTEKLSGKDEKTFSENIAAIRESDAVYLRARLENTFRLLNGAGADSEGLVESIVAEFEKKAEKELTFEKMDELRPKSDEERDARAVPMALMDDELKSLRERITVGNVKSDVRLMSVQTAAIDAVEAREGFKQAIREALSGLDSKSMNIENIKRVMDESRMDIFNALSDLSEALGINEKDDKHGVQKNMCSLACQYFKQVFNSVYQGAHRAVIISGFWNEDSPKYEHYWILIDNYIVIDLTYGQFDGKYLNEVLVTTKNDALAQYDLYSVDRDVELKDDGIYETSVTVPRESRVNESEERKKTSIVAFSGAFNRQNTVQVMVGIPESSTNKARYSDMRKELNKTLKMKIGDPSENLRNIFFDLVMKDGKIDVDMTQKAILKKLESVNVSLPTVLYVPSVLLRDGQVFRSDCEKLAPNIMLVPDAYTDSEIDLERGSTRENTFIDVMARSALAQLLAWYKDTNDNNVRQKIQDLLARISNGDYDLAKEGVTNVDALMKLFGSRALSIRPVDYKNMDDYMENQVAIAVSV